MSSVTVMPGDDLVSIAVRELGSEEGVYDLARLNGLNLTDDITPGSVLNIPTGTYKVKSADRTKIRPMAKTAIVEPGQTWIDLAVQYLGSEEGGYALASLNQSELTTDVAPGTVIKLPASIEDKKNEYYMRSGGYYPASSANTGNEEPLCEGIGCWIIQLEFIVS